MNRIIATSLTLTLAFSPPAVGQPVHAGSAVNSSQRPMENGWGYMSMLVGHYWIYQEGHPRTYLHFEWEVPGVILSYSGVDYDGYQIAGQFEFDSTTSHFVERNIRKGISLDSSLTITEDGFIETWSAGDSKVLSRKRYVWEGAGSFGVTTETFQNGSWQLSRNGRLGKASISMVEALGWIRRTAESEAAEAAARATALKASPSFGKRLGSAIQDGFTGGVQDGIHEGIQARVRGVIAPGAYPGGAPSQVIQQPATTQPQTDQSASNYQRDTSPSDTTQTNPNQRTYGGTGRYCPTNQPNC